MVAVRRNRRIYRRRFADGDHGGGAGALARARWWRNWLLRKLPPAVMIRKRFAPNTTGVVGVQLSRDRSRSRRLAPRYRATWYELDGRQRTRSFSVLKYGARRARALAAKVRREEIARILDERRRRN
jgi:hypothetical protein